MTHQWLKFVSNFPKKSQRFAMAWSPSDVSDAEIAWFADLVNDDVYNANVEHVTMSREYACISVSSARLPGAYEKQNAPEAVSSSSAYTP